MHDRHLETEPKLLEAASTATYLALDNARLHAEVKAKLAELRASRARLVLAADEERRRLERDLHDGAQQRLITVGMQLENLTRHLKESPVDSEADTLLAEAKAELDSSLDDLRDLAHGIRPAVLTDQGLAAAVDDLALRSPLPVGVRSGLTDRLAPQIEGVAYFVVAEALANAVKHSQARTVTVSLARSPSQLVVTVADDGVGGADPAGGGLQGLADRVGAVNGHLTVASPAGSGTTITAELPCV